MTSRVVTTTPGARTTTTAGAHMTPTTTAPVPRSRPSHPATRVTGASSAYPILYPSPQRPALHRRILHLTPGGSP